MIEEVSDEMGERKEAAMDETKVGGGESGRNVSGGGNVMLDIRDQVEVEEEEAEEAESATKATGTWP